MADQNNPSPPTAASNQVLPEGQLPAPGQNGEVGQVKAPSLSPKAAHLTLHDKIRWEAIRLAVALGLGLGAVLLLSAVGLDFRMAVGASAIIAVGANLLSRIIIRDPQPQTAAASSAPPQQHPDGTREIVETVVFVVVLVLLLKSFVAEAFVIPTGSMAETLWGYQKVVKCPQCGYSFPVNCSNEVDPSEGPPTWMAGCTCPNCRQNIRFLGGGRDAPAPAPPPEVPAPTRYIEGPGWSSGDRVLVAKFVYDLLGRLPDRLDVVVFKFPGDSKFPESGPVKKQTPLNYIKRLIGLPGETIAVYRGKLYYLSPGAGLPYENQDVEAAAGNRNRLAQLWQADPFMHKNDYHAIERFFQGGGFQIIRKGPEQLLAMMRLVYDNDHPARDLTGPEWQRWVPAEEGGWASQAGHAFRADVAEDNQERWLRYRHVLRGDGTTPRPQLITDFMGYNTWETEGHSHRAPAENWVSDLILECEAVVDRPTGELTLDLAKGNDRFQARFNLADGTCSLFRLDGDKPPERLDSARTKVKGKGTYALRFANVDDKLTVWVDNRVLPFPNGGSYAPAKEVLPVKKNDFDQPARIGVKGAGVVVRKLKLFRDTYYTNGKGGPNTADVPGFDPADPDNWKSLGGGWTKLGEALKKGDADEVKSVSPVATFYVQPGHFLCLGDNSPESSDGRSWGLVPQRLMLGRALLVYYPFGRAGRIR
jgi:signal peptidase I